MGEGINKALRELKQVDFDGCVNPDHHPKLEGDEGGITALGYAIGYIKACLAALSVLQEGLRNRRRRIWFPPTAPGLQLAPPPR